MYRAVQALLKTTTETSEIAALPGKLTAFESKLGEISLLGGTQSQPLRAKIAERDAVFASLIGTTLEIAGFVRSYADENELGELAVKVQVRPSDFVRMRPEQRIWLARQIHDAAQSALAVLADHGVTAASLDELQAKIDAATVALSKPRMSTVEKRAATARLVATLKEADAILENRIDPLIFPLRKTKPEFYAAYQAARMIVDRPGGRNASPQPMVVSQPPAERQAA